MVTKGQVVFSKSGHDKGDAFIVYSFDDKFVYLVDGNLRPVEKPKRKNIKHIQITHNIIDNIINGMEKELANINSDLRKALKPFKKNGKQS